MSNAKNNVPRHKALYVRKVDSRSLTKIERIVGELDLPKWVVVDAILSQALGVKTKTPLDLGKWLKIK